MSLRKLTLIVTFAFLWVTIGVTNVSAHSTYVGEYIWVPPNPRATNTLNNPPKAGIFDTNGKRLAILGNVPLGSSFAVVDVDSDGKSEIISGSGPGSKPRVNIFRSDGSLLRSFVVLDGKSSNGINIAAVPIRAGEAPTIFVVPRAGGEPRVWLYSVLGLPQTSFLAYTKSFRNGLYIAAGEVTGDGVADVVIGPGPGGHPTIKVFQPDGKLQTQYRQVVSPLGPMRMENQSQGVQVAIMPDFNLDGVDDIAGYLNGNGEQWTYYVHDARTGERIDPWGVYPWARVVDGKLTSRNFYDEVPSLDPTHMQLDDWRQGTFSVHTIGGKPRMLFTAAYSQGPLVLQTGHDDWKTIGAFSANWKGGVTAAAIDVNNDEVAEYVISPGTINDSLEMLKNYDFTQRSVLPQGVTHKLVKRRIKSENKSYSISTIIVDLHNPKLKVMTLAAACNRGDRCVNPLSFYVRRAKGFAGINGSTFTPGSGGFLALWYDSLRKQYEGTQSGGVYFDSKNRWYTDTGVAQLAYAINQRYYLDNQPAVLKMNQNALLRAKWFEAFQKIIGEKPRAHAVGFQMMGISTSFLGFKGGDMYIVHVSSASVVPAVLREYRFVKVEYMDGGGSVSQMYNGRYVAGPGRNIPNALVLSEQ